MGRDKTRAPAQTDACTRSHVTSSGRTRTPRVGWAATALACRHHPPESELFLNALKGKSFRKGKAVAGESTRGTVSASTLRSFPLAGSHGCPTHPASAVYCFSLLLSSPNRTARSSRQLLAMERLVFLLQGWQLHLPSCPYNFPASLSGSGASVGLACHVCPAPCYSDNRRRVQAFVLRAGLPSQTAGGKGRMGFRA